MTSNQRYFRMNPLSRFNLFQRLILAVGSGFMIAILLIIALSVLFSCSTKTFYVSSVWDRGTTVLTLKESMAKLQGINSRDDYDSVLIDYKYIVVDNNGESKKYSVRRFREILFSCATVKHNPRYRQANRIN